jgi:signal transduction histidine kinase/CheY-like chemotaxis protein
MTKASGEGDDLYSERTPAAGERRADATGPIPEEEASAPGEGQRRDRIVVQRERLEALGRLSGGVAHDFNNLLTAILGNVDQILPLVRYEDLDVHRSFLLESLSEILSAAERASSLTRQLLVFSRGERTEPRVIDLNDAVARLERMLRRLIPEHIDLRFSLEAAPSWVCLDPAQLEQVVMNLVLNARDATSLGGRVEVRTGNRVLSWDQAEQLDGISAGVFVTIEVRDTGHGMSAEVQTQAFEPFFTTKGAEAGTGLGLATVSGIVGEAGGTIMLESAPERGTSVKVLLPAEARPSRMRAARNTPVKAAGRGQRETVLVCEDEEIVRKIICRTIAAQGYEVLEASCASEALALFHAHQPSVSLLLTDVIMPGMNGKELADKVREQAPSLPVLFASGYTADVLDLQAGDIAAEDLLTKPFTPRDLLLRIREKLDGDGAVAPAL